MSYERLNAYHVMWLFVMFDLPVTTKKERKESALFRKNLEKEGFVMHQFSVYLRHCGSLESAQVHIKSIQILSIFGGKLRKKQGQLLCNSNFFDSFVHCECETSATLCSKYLL